jgi:uncharacterized membrane protein YphA (DoxX/SURF4 family)
MRTLSLSPLSRLASLAPLAVRVIAGIIMLAHGWQKLTESGSSSTQRLQYTNRSELRFRALLSDGMHELRVERRIVG